MKLTKKQIDEAARLLVFIRLVRNLNIGPHPIRAAAIDAEDTLTRLCGAEIERVYKSECWIKPEFPRGFSP